MTIVRAPVRRALAAVQLSRARLYDVLDGWKDALGRRLNLGSLTEERGAGAESSSGEMEEAPYVQTARSRRD